MKQNRRTTETGRFPGVRAKSRFSPLATILAAALLVAAALSLNGCYLLKQGTYLVSYNLRARNIGRLLERNSTAPATAEFLREVEDIKRFAIERIGLERGGNYTKYVSVGKEYLADVVSAVEPDSFSQYRWTFPFFGSFPYKGYFFRSDAERQAAKLKERGYDVLVRHVDAFSTLGFFSDPVFSFMKVYSVYALANLIIHEETHATIFLKNRVEFNEQLATFVGDTGALEYLKDRFGVDSEEYRKTLLLIEDQNTFINYLHRLYAALEELYRSDISRKEKISRKGEIIERYKKEFAARYAEMFHTDRFRGFTDVQVNNAYLAVYATYTQDLSRFYGFFRRHGSDLRTTVAALKELEHYKGDPFEYLSQDNAEAEGER